MHLHDVAADGKADACAAALGAALIKLLLDEGELVRGDALAEIPDMDDTLAVVGGSRDLDPVAVGAVFPGVVDDVQKD